jgi:c-di-GMP-binding flagellar brake protein YcgR
VFGTILKNLAVGTQCYLCLPLKDVSFIQCRAEIVRNTPGRGEYPAGVGIRFLGMSRAERRKLSSYLQQAA